MTRMKGKIDISVEKRDIPSCHQRMGAKFGSIYALTFTQITPPTVSTLSLQSHVRDMRHVGRIIYGGCSKLY